MTKKSRETSTHELLGQVEAEKKLYFLRKVVLVTIFFGFFASYLSPIGFAFGGPILWAYLIAILVLPLTIIGLVNYYRSPARVQYGLPSIFYWVCALIILLAVIVSWPVFFPITFSFGGVY